MTDGVRLIDANDYRKRRCRTCINRVQCDDGGNLCFDIMVLNTCPTIEAQPVKHGRWVVNGDRFYPFCSNCKYEPPKELIRCNALSLEPILTKHCPNCGSENGTRIYRGGENNG